MTAPPDGRFAQLEALEAKLDAALAEVRARLEHLEALQGATLLGILHPDADMAAFCACGEPAGHDGPCGDQLVIPAHAPRIDSEAWTCASCKGPFIGGRPGDDLCRECTGRMLAASIDSGKPLPVEDDDMEDAACSCGWTGPGRDSEAHRREHHPEDPEQDPASLVGTIVARIIDDSPGPLTGRVVGQVDEDRVEVLWGDAQYSQHGDAWRPDTEYIDELRPVTA